MNPNERLKRRLILRNLESLSESDSEAQQKNISQKRFQNEDYKIDDLDQDTEISDTFNTNGLSVKAEKLVRNSTANKSTCKKKADVDYCTDDSETSSDENADDNKNNSDDDSDSDKCLSDENSGRKNNASNFNSRNQPHFSRFELPTKEQKVEDFFLPDSNYSDSDDQENENTTKSNSEGAKTNKVPETNATKNENVPLNSAEEQRTQEKDNTSIGDSGTIKSAPVSAKSIASTAKENFNLPPPPPFPNCLLSEYPKVNAGDQKIKNGNSATFDKSGEKRSVNNLSYECNPRLPTYSDECNSIANDKNQRIFIDASDIKNMPLSQFEELKRQIQLIESEKQQPKRLLEQHVHSEPQCVMNSDSVNLSNSDVKPEKQTKGPNVSSNVDEIVAADTKNDKTSTGPQLNVRASMMQELLSGRNKLRSVNRRPLREEQVEPNSQDLHAVITAAMKKRLKSMNNDDDDSAFDESQGSQSEWEDSDPKYKLNG